MMTKAGDRDAAAAADSEEDCFYESFDRIASSPSTTSSCSSPPSISDDEDISFPINSPNDSAFSVPKFPMGASKYDIWISEPSSIGERRMRLLQEMGLGKDPSLSRVKPVFTFDYREMANGDFGRSVSSDQLSSQQHLAENSGIIRSKSDGSSNCCNSSSGYQPEKCQCTTQSVCSHSVLSIRSSLLETKRANVNNNVSHNCNHFVDVNVRNGEINGSSISNMAITASAGLPNRPPTGKNIKTLDEIQSDFVCSCVHTNSSSTLIVSNTGHVELDEDLPCNGIVEVNKQMCMIKNLDNGKEFVVNEIREDGMWNKLKEVGTGKQLTMEEFELCVGHSPIVQELMRRQNVEDGNKDNLDSNGNGGNDNESILKKKGGWFKSIKNVASSVGSPKERRSSDERDTSSEKGRRRSSSATDDSQDVLFHGPERVRVRQYGKSCKELTALYKSQEIQAHNGSIWSIKFSLDGRYLATAGEDCVIHIWKVIESERKGELLMEKPEDVHFNIMYMSNGSPELTSVSPSVDNNMEKKRRGRSSLSRKSISLEQVVVPETVFGLSEKPFCSFQGHLDDVLDLSWSKSQHLLSSSMDKTVRLWHLSSKSCLKIFSHGDYVTCIQFNPVDERYFISGSLDAKVRIWSIPDRHVVDWYDLHEMVTAACYTPDGQAALVGSYKGSCCLFNTSDNKLQQKSQINLQNKKKKSHHKKITGFQFAPQSSTEVLVTSADSRVRVVDGVDLVHKFKGFRNSNSQIASSFTANGKYVVSASEDSNVYVWKHEGDSRPSRSKSVTVTRSYEHFHCQDVSVAIPWPGMSNIYESQDNYSVKQTGLCPGNQFEDGNENSLSASYFIDRISSTWPEEKLLLATKNHSPHVSIDFSNGLIHNRSVWGMVFVTAGLRGKIRTFQNFGLPVRI